MIALCSATQRRHDPQFFLSSGAQKPCPEKPARIDALLQGLDKLGIEPQEPQDHGIDAIAAIHPERYLTFLQTIHTRWSRIDGASAEVIPNIHPASRPNSFTPGYPLSAVGQAGFHMADASCPIGPHTWAAAYAQSDEQPAPAPAPEMRPADAEQLAAMRTRLAAMKERDDGQPGKA